MHDSSIFDKKGGNNNLAYQHHREEGTADMAIQGWSRLYCPVGLGGIDSRLPRPEYRSRNDDASSPVVKRL